MKQIRLDTHLVSETISDHCVLASTKQQYLLADSELFSGSVPGSGRMAQFLQNTGQDHHENWTSNQVPVPFPRVHDTLCLLEYEAGFFIKL